MKTHGDVDWRSLVPRRLWIVVAVVFALGVGAVPAQAQEQGNTNVTIQSAELINNFQVRVSGTVTCEGPTGYYGVNVGVLQQGPQRELRGGSGWISDTCTGSGPETWIVTVTGGPFNPGKALVQASAFSCDEDSCGQDTDERTIRLRR